MKVDILDGATRGFGARHKQWLSLRAAGVGLCRLFPPHWTHTQLCAHMFVLFYDDCWKICTVWDKFDWTQILQLYKTRSLLAQVFLLWSKTRKREMYRVIGKSIVSENNVVVVDSQIITSFAEKYLAGHRSKPEDGPVNFFRSRSDKFDYKLLQLPSGLRILLISDPSGDELDPHLSCPFESILTRSSKMDKSRSSKSKKSQKSFKSNVGYACKVFLF